MNRRLSARGGRILFFSREPCGRSKATRVRVDFLPACQFVVQVSTSLTRRLAVSHRAVATFRTWLGAVVLVELIERIPSLPWLYTDAGAFPRWAVMPPAEVAPTLHAACIHAWSGSLGWQYALLGMQIAAAGALCCGSWPRIAAGICWVLHASSMLRNPQLSFIFDRYLHVLLLLAACMPTSHGGARASAASCALAAQLILIYVDAGLGKLTSPDAAWTVGAEVGALDTYMRHTPVARFARWLLGASALRYVGALTAWLELTIAPLAFVAPTQTSRRCCIAAAIGLHVGIALTMRNTFALSLAGVAAWLPFVDGPPPSPPSPPLAPSAGIGGKQCSDGASVAKKVAAQPAPAAATPSTASSPRSTRLADAACSLVVGAFAIGCAWHQLSEFGAPACAASATDAALLLQSTLLHNRWNVFTGAEPYVVWEVAPARLDDGSIVDLWRGTESVSWEVPRGAAPAHRGGRWRSWPYLAERTPEAEDAFWGTLCDEWEARDGSSSSSPFSSSPASSGRRVVSFVFYLLQADVVPAAAQPAAPTGGEAGGWAGYLPEYGPVRKRRIRQFSCLERQRRLEEQGGGA